MRISVSGLGSPPSPEIAVSPSRGSFGCVRVGSSRAMDFTVSNRGGLPLDIYAIELSNGAMGFSFDQTSAPAPPCPVGASSGYTLNPGDYCHLRLVFRPADTTSYTDSITIRSGDPAKPEVTVNLSGSGAYPSVSVSPLSHNFGDVYLNTRVSREVVISNTGCLDLTLRGIDLSQRGTTFSLDLNGGQRPCGSTFPRTLLPGESCTVIVSATPATTGADSATLSVTSDDPNSPAEVSFQVNGIATTAVSTGGGGCSTAHTSSSSSLLPLLLPPLLWMKRFLKKLYKILLR